MIKIISIFDKNEDFIELQYKSILKHIKGDFEYIIFNNGSTENQKKIIEDICLNFKIKSIKIYVNYNQDPSHIAGTALNESFSHLKNNKVFKIDSDMFFISDINIDDIFQDDLIYIPYNNQNNELMWSGIFGINKEKVIEQIDFKPNVIPRTDTFGYSSVLVDNKEYTKKKFKLFNLQNINQNIITTSFCNSNLIIIKDKLIQSKEFDLQMTDQLYIDKINEMIEVVKKYDFPDPCNFDICTLDDKNFIFHFKSSNWYEYPNNEHLMQKKNALKQILNQ